MAEFRRRTVLAGGLAAGLVPQAARAAGAAEIIPIWPDGSPGGGGSSVVQRSVLRTPTSPPTDIATYGITRPTLAVLRPERPNGMAVLMCPGGGYTRVAMAPDGGALARHFAGLGFTVGSLLYRLPGDGWAAGPDAPLQDGQRAFRLLARLSGARLTGVMGFSAGGHLAGMVATRFAQRSYPRRADETDAPARPAFAGLLYPVITLSAPHAHKASRDNLLGSDLSPERIRRWSVESTVPAGTPPTFLAAAADDRVVPVDNSLMMFAALRAAGIRSACHIFDEGGHGFGSLTDPAGPGRYWPQLFTDWLTRQKL